MSPEHIFSIYVWSVALGVIAIIFLVVSMDMQKSGKSGSAEVKFAGIACAALAIIFASCSYFVTEVSNHPLHIEHAP